MAIIEEVKAVLEHERKDMLQREIADRHHITQSYVNNLLSGKRDVSQITLGTFERMFPRAEVFLDGAPGSHIATASGDGSAAAVNGNATVNPVSSASNDVEAYRGRLALKVAALKLPAEHLAAVMTAITDTK